MASALASIASTLGAQSMGPARAYSAAELSAAADAAGATERHALAAKGGSGRPTKGAALGTPVRALPVPTWRLAATLRPLGDPIEFASGRASSVTMGATLRSGQVELTHHPGGSTVHPAWSETPTVSVYYTAPDLPSTATETIIVGIQYGHADASPATIIIRDPRREQLARCDASTPPQADGRRLCLALLTTSPVVAVRGRPMGAHFTAIVVAGTVYFHGISLARLER